MPERQDWHIAGSYYESCNCNAVCPCRRSSGNKGGRSTFRLCQFLLSWHVNSGHANDVDLSGRGIAMAGFYDNEVEGGPWTVSLYIDHQASDPAFHALSDIFLGNRGGNILFVQNIVDVLAIRRAEMELDHQKNHERISIREFAESETKAIAEDSGTVSCGIPGHDHPGIESISSSLVTDDKLFWAYVGRCGFATDFEYHS